MLSQFSSLNFSKQVDTYTAIGNGTAIEASVKSYGLQVKGTGATALVWDVKLEASLDGTNYVTILTHTQLIGTGDGNIIYSGFLLSPSLFLRSRCATLVLGSASNIVVTIVGAT